MKRLVSCCMSVFLIPGAAWATAPGVTAPDLEAGMHDFEDARPRVIGRYVYPGAEVIQVHLPVLSQYSYLVVSERKALVVDPVRDVDAYFELAGREGFEITGVFLTHNNADFVAGHTEVAARTGCPVLISENAGAGFAFQGLKDGMVVDHGQVKVTFISTPGHTPESMCALVAGSEDPGTPLALLSGDTLFIGSVGRPDLVGGDTSAAWLAGKMWESWHEKLEILPNGIDVLPGHGAGSLCGAHLSDQPTSTLAEQKVANPYLRITTRSAFIAAILQELPVTPRYFGHAAAMNRRGPERTGVGAGAPSFTVPPPELRDTKSYYLIDIRGAKEYAGGHVPGAINIGLRGRFETWVGTIVTPDARLILFGSPETFEVTAFWLSELVERRRSGEGRYWGSPFLSAFSLLLIAFAATGFLFPDGVTLVTSRESTDVAMLTRIDRGEDHIEPGTLARRLSAGDPDLVLVDVRPLDEFENFHLRGAVRIDLPDLVEALEPHRRGSDIVLYSNGMTHPAQARDVLERAGYRSVSILTDGLAGFVERCLKPVSLREDPPGEEATVEIQAWREYFLHGDRARKDES